MRYIVERTTSEIQRYLSQNHLDSYAWLVNPNAATLFDGEVINGKLELSPPIMKRVLDAGESLLITPIKVVPLS